MKYCDNYLNLLRFPNSKMTSFRRNCMRKYGISFSMFIPTLYNDDFFLSLSLISIYAWWWKILRRINRPVTLWYQIHYIFTWALTFQPLKIIQSFFQKELMFSSYSLKSLCENLPLWFRELSSDHKAEDNKHQEAVVLHFFVSREPIWWKHVLWKMLFESLVSTYLNISMYVCTTIYIFHDLVNRNKCLINQYLISRNLTFSKVTVISFCLLTIFQLFWAHSNFPAGLWQLFRLPKKQNEIINIYFP